MYQILVVDDEENIRSLIRIEHNNSSRNIMRISINSTDYLRCYIGGRNSNSRRCCNLIVIKVCNNYLTNHVARNLSCDRGKISCNTCIRIFYRE